jgi:hypothetical protein
VIAIEPTTTGEPTRRKHRRPRFSDEAAARTELIISGQLSAGEFIRPETVAQELEISVTPAREGLLALQSERLPHGATPPRIPGVIAVGSRHSGHL